MAPTEGYMLSVAEESELIYPNFGSSDLDGDNDIDIIQGVHGSNIIYWYENNKY